MGKERNELIGALQLSKIIETYNTYSSKELINRVKENDQLAKEIHALELAQKNIRTESVNTISFNVLSRMHTRFIKS